MNAGDKVSPPFIRGTGRSGTIHAMVNETGRGKAKEAPSLCRRITMTPDEEGKRFQVGLEANCSWCEERVMIERSKIRAAKHNEAAKTAKESRTLAKVGGR